MTAKEFIGELNGKEVEGELIKTFLYSLVVSIAILGIAYFIKLVFLYSICQNEIKKNHFII